MTSPKTSLVSSKSPLRKFGRSSTISSKIGFNFRFYPAQDDHRHELSYKSGGKICGDKMQIEKVRGIGKEMIMEIGRKLITGDLNLTKVSFPIKAMVPRTSL